MPGIIDSFFVELGLDASKFTKGQRETVQDFKKSQEEFERRAKSMESRAQSAGDFFGKLRGQVIALYGAFTMGRGIREFVQDTISTTANLGRMSRTMDISAQDLSSWRGAATQMGGSAGEMDQSIYSLTQSLQQFMLTGESSVIPYFRALGISITDTNGKLKTATQLYEEASAKVQGMDPARATALLTSLGANQSMINFLLQGPKAVGQQLAYQRRFAPTAEDIRRAQQYQQAWADIDKESQATGRTILMALEPAILKVLRAVREFFEYLRTHKGAAMAAFYAISAAVGVLSIGLTINLLGALKNVVAVGFGGLARVIGFFTATLLPNLLLGLATLTETTLPALSAAFLSVGAAIEATPVGWILTALAAIGFAGYELYKHWSDIKHWWHGLWNDMGDDAEVGSRRIRRVRSDFSSENVDQLPLYHGAVVHHVRGALNRIINPDHVQYVSTNKYGMVKESRDIDQRKKVALEFFAGAGWAPVQAAAIVANLDYESSLNPNQPTNSPGENGWGIAQWHGSREKQFQKVFGRPLRGSSLEDQLKYVNWELNNEYSEVGDRLRRAYKTRSATDILLDQYESPANPNQSRATRRSYADENLSILSALHIATAGYAKVSRLAPFANKSVSSHHSVHIAKIEVNTQATDGRGVGRSIGGAIRENTFAAQANYGPA